MYSAYPQPPKYVMLNDPYGGVRPPPHRRNIHHYHSHHRGSGGRCCLKCLCCCYCCLLLLIFVLFGVSFFLYAVFKPQKPSYKVNHVAVNAFNVQQNLSLCTEFNVAIKADNPNSHIGFVYGQDSTVVVIYSGRVLCSGKLPSFEQHSKNVTMMDVVLKGKDESGQGLHDSLLKDQKAGKIPLLIMVRAPVSIVLGDFPLRQVVIFVNCSLVVDNFSPNHKIGIVSSKYDYKVSL